MGKPTSAYFDKESADLYTQLAMKEGNLVPGRPGVFDLELGIPVGTGPKGGYQTKIRVYVDSKGITHSHPAEPEY